MTYDRDLDRDVDLDRDLGTRGDENDAKGGMKKMGGKVQEGLGKLTGDRSMETKGKMKQAEGSLQEGVGNAERNVDDMLDR